MLRTFVRIALSTYWPALAWMLVIFALSSIPGVARPDDPDVYSLFVWVPPDVQNLFHIPVFGLLAWLWQQAFRSRGYGMRSASMAALVITVGYGVLDEWHQSFVYGRYASITDVALDATGAILVVLLTLRAARPAPES